MIMRYNVALIAGTALTTNPILLKLIDISAAIGVVVIIIWSILTFIKQRNDKKCKCDCDLCIMSCKRKDKKKKK